MFEDELNCNRFLKELNSLHQSLTFTHEKEVNGKLPFLDVLVENSNTKFLTSVYRKPSFSGQYNRWDSFGPKSRKNNLIGTLVHRALAICSPSKLPQEIDFIRSILCSNGYPENVINSRLKSLNYRQRKDRKNLQLTLNYHGLAISPQNLKINAKPLSAHVLVQ